MLTCKVQTDSALIISAGESDFFVEDETFPPSFFVPLKIQLYLPEHDMNINQTGA